MTHYTSWYGINNWYRTSKSWLVNIRIWDGSSFLVRYRVLEPYQLVLREGLWERFADNPTAFLKAPSLCAGTYLFYATATDSRSFLMVRFPAARSMTSGSMTSSLLSSA